MKRSWIVNARRAGFAFAAAFAAEAAAYDWCPSPGDEVVSCSHCTVTLTCDYQGQIQITGSDVHLDGNYHWIYLNQGDGVLVTGNSTHISRLGIYAPQHNGLVYGSPAPGNAGHSASEVWIYYAGHSGVRHVAHSNGAWIQLMGLTAYYNGEDGITSFQKNGNTNVFDSYLNWNARDGFYSSEPGYQTHARNDYSGNGVFGASANFSSNEGYYSTSTFNDNGQIGLWIQGVNGPYPLGIYNNSGFGNSWGDCYGIETQHLSVYGNSWGTNYGCVNKP